MFIKNKMLIDSDFLIELPISYINDKNVQDRELMVNEIKLKIPRIDIIDFNIENYIYSNSNPDNKLIIKLK
jgi:hypothetical protein